MPSPDLTYCSRKDHRFHAMGTPKARQWQDLMSLPRREMARINNRLKYCGWMDKAWTVMLYKQGLIKKNTARKLLTVLKSADHEHGWGGEDWLKEKLDGDEHTASAVNLGRTLQEPMARMQMREKVLDVIDTLLEGMNATLTKAEANADAVMAGQSHFSHAQPTTYGAYLIAIHEGLARGLAQLELAYRFTNMNSAGCGACSGTGWPVDRRLVTDLLGFDALIEPTYDCEGSQDEIPQILFALSSIALTLTRTGLDHGIWSLEEINMIQLKPGWLGCSSFMPQKAHTGGNFENVRDACNHVLGQMMSGVMTFKGESIQDNLPVYRAPAYALAACCHTQQAVGLFTALLNQLIVNKDKMWTIVREGYSGAPDLAIKLIGQKDYGSRQAHRICANSIRMARERGIKPYEMGGALLDEAARVTDEPEPGLSDAEVQECMGLEHFLEKHNNVGDPCPSETHRLATLRREELARSRERQAQRHARIEKANARLAGEIKEILEG